MSKIATKSNKANREIDLDAPEILEAGTLADLVNAQGEELCVSQIKAQLTIGFRSHIRSKLESMTDDNFTHEDEAIQAMDFTDWKPEARTRKTAEEKAMDILGSLPPEVRAAVLANYKK